MSIRDMIRAAVARAGTYDRILNAMQPALGAALREQRAQALAQSKRRP